MSVKTIAVPKFTEGINLVSIGNSLLWNANGVSIRCITDNLMITNGRRICTLQMVAGGFIVATVDIRFKTRTALSECVQRANQTGSFEPRCGTYRIV